MREISKQPVMSSRRVNKKASTAKRAISQGWLTCSKKLRSTFRASNSRGKLRIKVVILNRCRRSTTWKRISQILKSSCRMTLNFLAWFSWGKVTICLPSKIGVGSTNWYASTLTLHSGPAFTDWSSKDEVTWKTMIWRTTRKWFPPWLTTKNWSISRWPKSF